MKKIALAILTSVALALPAFAADGIQLKTTQTLSKTTAQKASEKRKAAAAKLKAKKVAARAKGTTPAPTK